MQRNYLLVLVLLLMYSFVCAQKQGNIWYFGWNAGISFNSGAPVALTDGALNQSEGCATIADGNGKLLFYTNGSQIWDRNHVVMPNGSGLRGQNISAQSAIIVPLPQSTTLYYVFTIGDWTNGSLGAGLNYSIVDMSLNNGLGDVTTKNSLLIENAREQVTAVHHSNCQDVWVVTHEKGNTNRYQAFLLTAAGVNTTAVTSAVGMNYNGGNRYGYLKASHDGKKLCSTLGYSAASSSIGTVELCDFNNSTGQVSNPVTLATHSVIPDAYASEFSPDNSKLYVVSYNRSFINQYDLSLASAAIAGSSINIATGTSTKTCVQLGPDKKIYVSRGGDDYLGVINNPNTRGILSNYVDDGVSLEGRSASLGLPNFNALYFSYPDLGPDTMLCNGTTLPLDVSGLGSTSYLWQDASAAPVFTVNQPGLYWVEVTSSTGCRKRDSVNVVFSSLQVDLGNDTTVCSGKSLQLDAASSSGDSYLWQDGATGVNYPVSLAGKYWVDVFKNGCKETDTILVAYAALPNVTLGNDTTVCNNSTLVLNAGVPGSLQYAWQDGSVANTYTVSQPGQYWVHVSNSGCKNSDTIQVVYARPPVIDLGRDTTLCEGSFLSLNAMVNVPASWQWQDGSVDPMYKVVKSGRYRVNITTACEVVSDSVVVKFENCNCRVKVPNAFTPDGNGRNDAFKPVTETGCQLTEYRLTIYNRWGERIFDSGNPAVGWNGKYKSERAASGGYAYIMRFRTYGSTVTETRSGVVMLLR